MPSLFPGIRALSENICSPFQYSNPDNAPTSSNLARHELYSAWSVADDAKAKGAQLSDAAVKEFEKASNKAQAKAGNIELYSPKYYGACTFGGLLACVGISNATQSWSHNGAGYDPLGCHAP
ncbi:Cu/Pi carrier [Zalaria obscura]|uniref:Cu/Pi carrier n=1 Tax=Zalaria obscura TaxID=2024903 RepID=A0ACC3SMM2_9PEZI